MAGDSGVGKSSLCRAGILSQVRRGRTRRCRSFRVTMFGKRPLSTLAEEMAPLLGCLSSTLLQELMTQPADFVRRIHQAQRQREGCSCSSISWRS